MIALLLIWGVRTRSTVEWLCFTPPKIFSTWTHVTKPFKRQSSECQSGEVWKYWEMDWHSFGFGLFMCSLTIIKLLSNTIAFHKNNSLQQAILHAADKNRLSVRMAMPRQTRRVGGKTRPLTSAAFRRSAMASSLLSLASNHLADWGSTLTGDRESRQGEKGEEKEWTEARERVRNVHSGSNVQMSTEFFPPYIEDEQEARGGYSQLQLSPVSYQVCYAC